MIGLDTNILLRFFTQDDPVQTQLVNALLEEELSEEAPGFISLVTMAETVWVLRRAYKLSNEEIFQVVANLLQIRRLRIQNESDVLLAAIEMRAGRGSFADVLIGRLNAGAGCTTTVTFDRKASKLDGFTLLQ